MKSDHLVQLRRLCALCLLTLCATTRTEASIPIRNLGSNSFEIDTSVTTAAFSQSGTSLILGNTFGLGDTLGGAFGSLANPISLDLRGYPALGLRMSLSGGTSMIGSFSVEFFTADSFSFLAKFSGETSTVGTNSAVVWLSPTVPNFNSLTNVGGMQLTWDTVPSPASFIVIESFVGAEDGGYFAARSPGGFRFFSSTNQTSGAKLPAGETAWSVLCDSNAKTAVTPLDHRQTLREVARVPVTLWKYKHDPQRRYLGPMAQDFHAAFGLGFDDKHISTLDTDGVALSALKGLIEELRQRKARSTAQSKRLAELESQLRAMYEKLSELPPVTP